MDATVLAKRLAGILILGAVLGWGNINCGDVKYQKPPQPGPPTSASKTRVMPQMQPMERPQATPASPPRNSDDPVLAFIKLEQKRREFDECVANVLSELTAGCTKESASSTTMQNPQ